MASTGKVIASILLLCFLFNGEKAGCTTASSADGNQMWGYTQVRPKAHLFWWFYKSPQRVSSPAKQWPTVLWLQGGPGGSGVGGGNFMGVGPLDTNLKPRNSTWLQKADLLFVDLPVGVGYSYAEDPSLLARTDSEVVADASALLKALAVAIPTLQSSPLFLVGESYGGKLAAMIGVDIARSIHAGSLKLTLGGVVLGDSWISPADFALSYAELLHQVSRLDANDVAPANKIAAKVKDEMAAGQFAKARITWVELSHFIDSNSASVNWENFMLDSFMTHQSGLKTIDGIMNGVIKQKLKIIPKDVVWQRASIPVNNALDNVFMKPAINEVDELLAYGVVVAIYNGQFDLICSTVGVEGWVRKLKWDGLKNFLSLPRQDVFVCDTSVHCSGGGAVRAFMKTYQNLHFYWILGAGHTVPVDQPDVALQMIGQIVAT
ncbi:serine carboxypeptidase-like 51 [Lolium perenne]|uniref:serine carboxypeptidase-like 51 n=1 Tax=Lolium perenne TaxID=4522 RepID=UPI0021F53FD3|nr:serine carboxypeptidase-like 51 [Lolium perenne]